MYKVGIISEAHGTIPLKIPLVIPLRLESPSPVPEPLFTYLESLLCVWCDSRPLWSQVACVLTFPLPLPFPSSFPAPQRFPNSNMCPPTTTLRHRLHIVRYNYKKQFRESLRSNMNHYYQRWEQERLSTKTLAL
jgi:hypothetical protein